MTWLSAKEVAKKSGASENAIYHYQRKMGFDKKRVGGRVFYDESCVKAISEYRAVHGRAKRRSDGTTKIVKSADFIHCPICGSELLDLERGEKRCRECDKYFKGGREIMYNVEGSVVFLE